MIIAGLILERGMLLGWRDLIWAFWLNASWNTYSDIDSTGNVTYKVNSYFFKLHRGHSNLLSLLNMGKFS